jgi:DNA-binding PadR family transcriptional regulator
MLTLFEAKSKNKQYARQVLSLLAQSSAIYVSVDELAETTKLASVVYPVLSKLHKQGMVEPHWVQSIAGPKLNYQITLKGLEYARHISSTSTNATYPWAFAEPLLTKLKSWFAETDSSQSK